MTSGAQGTLVFNHSDSLPGRYVKKGEVIGYVVNPEHLLVRVALPQQRAGLLTDTHEEVAVRLVENPQQKITGRLARQTPSGTTKLPSRALGVAGGGQIAIDTTDKSGTTAAEKIFLIDIDLPDDLQTTGIGSRAHVRLSHGREPLLEQWLRHGQQLLLRVLPL